jgi:hypothetical protein
MSSKDFVNDGLPNEEIFKIVNDIIDTLKKNKFNENTIKDLKTKYMFFENRYPSLFGNVIKEDFDYKSFEYMMNMRQKIINDNTTVEEASKEIGTKFYNKYQTKSI